MTSPQEGRIIVPTVHDYQPKRDPSVAELVGTSTDPEGKSWTPLIARETYRRRALLGLYGQTSFDAYATLRHDLQRYSSVIDLPSDAPVFGSGSNIDLLTWQEINRQLAERGLGDCFLHIILPHLDRRGKRLLIKAGLIQFIKDTGAIPKWFWAPESALDNETLEVLVEMGYQGVLCAPTQVRRFDRLQTDNRPTRVQLPNGKSIVLLPFEGDVSHKLAFNDKSNADRFADDHIMANFERVAAHGIITFMTDGETFGHHDKGGHLFLDYLLRCALPNRGVTVASINELPDLFQRRGYDFAGGQVEGELNENTAWSCPHGKLQRWKGPCDCTPGGEWKTAYYQLFADFHRAIRDRVTEELGPHDDVLAENFAAALYNTGIDTTPTMSLLSAEASSLATRTSCATFFPSPHTSGNMNVLDAVQTLLHLEKAGLVKPARNLRRELETRLAQIPDNTQSGKSLLETMDEMVHPRVLAVA